MKPLLFLALSLPLLAQDAIPPRMVREAIDAQLKARAAEDKSAKAIGAIQQFCKGRDQIALPAQDGIALSSKCGPKPLITKESPELKEENKK